MIVNVKRCMPIMCSNFRITCTSASDKFSAWPGVHTEPLAAVLNLYRSRIQGTGSDSTDGETRNSEEEERRGGEETEKTNSLSDVSVSSSSSSSSSSSAFDLTVTASSSAPSPPEKPKCDDVTTEERPITTAAPPQSQTLEFQHSLSSASDAETRNESLRMKIWNLENQIESLTQNRIALKQLLLETCLQEKSFLDHNKRTAEDEVIRAQKLVSER